MELKHEITVNQATYSIWWLHGLAGSATVKWPRKSHMQALILLALRDFAPPDDQFQPHNLILVIKEFGLATWRKAENPQLPIYSSCQLWIKLYI